MLRTAGCDDLAVVCVCVNVMENLAFVYGLDFEIKKQSFTHSIMRDILKLSIDSVQPQKLFKSKKTIHKNSD